MKQTWEDLLKPIPLLAEDEITIGKAEKMLGLDRYAAESRLNELVKTGKVVFLEGAERRTEHGRIAVKIWKIVDQRKADK